MIKTTEELLELVVQWQRARIVHETAQDEAQRTYRELVAAEKALAALAYAETPPRSWEEAREMALADIAATSDEEDARLHAAALADPDNPPPSKSEP